MTSHVKDDKLVHTEQLHGQTCLEAEKIQELNNISVSSENQIQQGRIAAWRNVCWFREYLLKNPAEGKKAQELHQLKLDL